MSTDIDVTTAMQLFDTEVTLKYQNSQKLMNTIVERHGTTGTTLNVPVSDLIEMTQGTFAPTDIPVTAVNETNVTIVANDYRIKTVVGGGQKTLFNYDKITNHAKLHALSAARLVDYIKLNAIFASASFSSINTTASTVGKNTGINEGKIADALGYLESQGLDVQDYKVSMWAPALTKKSMFDDDKIVNFFYSDVKPLTSNKIQSYLGVDCRFMGENGVNRIPRTGSGTTQSPYIYYVPMVHEDAIVQTFNRDVKTSITWLEHQDRWDLLTIVTTGAGIVQLNGISLMIANVPFAANT